MQALRTRRGAGRKTWGNGDNRITEIPGRSSVQSGVQSGEVSSKVRTPKVGSFELLYLKEFQNSVWVACRLATGMQAPWKAKIPSSSWSKMGSRLPYIRSEPEPLKKSPIIADENTKGFLEVHPTGKWGISSF